MVLDRKHFDDVDDFCDFDDKLDTSCSDSDGEAGPNHPLAWRRIIIERAVNNVKKAHENKTDLRASYKKGALVFDEEANKFGRVIESRPGFLNLSLLAGGKVVRKDINELDFVRDNRHKMTLPEMAANLSITEVQVISLLNQLENIAEPVTIKLPKVKQTLNTPKKEAVVKVAKKPAAKKPVVKAAAPKEPIKMPAKATVKLAAKKKSTTKKKPMISKEIPGTFTKLLPKGATTDPVMDPNGYIQQNFLLMSNRELATATGLSEHTIRRKLGEWNLKRKDYVNKA